MTATDVLRTLRRAGVVLEVSGSALLVTPARKLTDELRSLICAFKEELVCLVLHESNVEAFEERAAMVKVDARMTRPEAEAAARIVIANARRNHADN